MPRTVSRPEPKFNGTLAEPIPFELGLLARGSESDSEFREAVARANEALAEARMSKLGPLLDHFDILQTDPLAFIKLALRLAIAFVPGFSVLHPHTPKKGPSRKLDLFHIGVAVLELTQKTGMSERSACFALVKRQEFSQYKAETLYRRYKLLKQLTTAAGGSEKLLHELIGNRPPIGREE